MTKDKLDKMINYSLYGVPVSDDDWYTKSDFEEGYHFCGDWDGLFIEPGGEEWDSCTCHPLKNKRSIWEVRK